MAEQQQKNLIITAYGLSSTGKGQNLDNMYINGRYINVQTETMSRIQKTENAPFQVYGVSDSEIGAEDDRSIGMMTGQIVMDMLQRTQNTLGGSGKIEKDRIWESVLEANKEIKDKRIELGRDVLGTSFAALFMHGNRGLAVHLGDSRIYVIRGGRMLQITDDHLESSDMFRLGILSQAQAEVHKSSSRLTAYVGMDGVYDARDEAFSKYFIFYPGDTFILCTDGMSDAILNDEMERVTRLLKDATPDQIASTMMDAANEHSLDDKTMVVLHVEEAPGEAPKRGVNTLPRRENFEKQQEQQAAAQRPIQQPRPMPQPQPVPESQVDDFRREQVTARQQRQTLAPINNEGEEEQEGAPSLLDQLLSDPKRLAIVIGCAVAFIILLIIIISAIANGGKNKKTDNNSSGGNSSTTTSQISESSLNSGDSSDISQVFESSNTGESSDSSTGESSEGGESSEASESSSTVTQEYTYTVESGDTLYDIVVANYGTGDVDLIMALAEYNGIDVNAGLDVGQTLRIPPESELR